MNFSPQQLAALSAVQSWFQAGDQQVFRLFGYAGTGKTTLAQELAAKVPGRVMFAAYTGKAAHVMRQRGCPEASTIHRLIYTPSGKSHEHLLKLQELLGKLLEAEYQDENQIEMVRDQIRAETDNVKQPAFILNVESELHRAALVIIDECSMVDERMGKDLCSFGKPILVLGDPAQLPPVRGAGFFTGQDPDIMLSQIHRQAEGNPIIELATRVRTGGQLEEGRWGDSWVGKQTDFSKALASSVDQVIVGRNATRRKFNANYRQHILGFQGELPVAGDKLVCLRNNHELGLLNGALWSVVDSHHEVDSSQVSLEICETGESDSPVSQTLYAHAGIFRGEEIDPWSRRDAEEFDYGYALTCHKSQGSQWPKVLIFDESGCFQDKARQWLYTAITRASESVVILK